VTAFTLHQDVAAVECDPASGPFEGGQSWPATVTEVKPWSIRVRLDGGGDRLFLVDSRGRAWRDSGRLRLFPLCRCDSPVLGDPVTDPDDLRREEFCGPDCLTAAAEGSYEQRYRPGVAT
jgi:hypothetical protein